MECGKNMRFTLERNVHFQNVKMSKMIKNWKFDIFWRNFNFRFFIFVPSVSCHDIFPFCKIWHFLHSFSKTWKNQNLSFVGILPNLKKLWPFLGLFEIWKFYRFCHFHFKTKWVLKFSIFWFFFQVKNAFFAIFRDLKSLKLPTGLRAMFFLKSNLEFDDFKHNFKMSKMTNFTKIRRNMVLNFKNSKCEILSKNWKKTRNVSGRDLSQNLKFRRKIMIFRKIKSKF